MTPTDDGPSRSAPVAGYWQWLQMAQQATPALIRRGDPFSSFMPGVIISSRPTLTCTICVSSFSLFMMFYHYFPRAIHFSLLSSTFASVAFILTWVSEFNCKFIKFSTTNLSDEIHMQYGIWSFQFWSAAATVDGTFIFETCHGYPEQTADGLAISPDSKWKAARAFSIITLVIGGIFFFSNMFRGCNKQYNEHLFVSRGEAFGYLLTCFCSGMTLILLNSSLCTNNIMMEGVKAATPLLEWEDTCSISTGAKCVISATVFWFLAGFTSMQGWKAEHKEDENEGALSDPLIQENL